MEAVIPRDVLGNISHLVILDRQEGNNYSGSIKSAGKMLCISKYWYSIVCETIRMIFKPFMFQSPWVLGFFTELEELYLTDNIVATDKTLEKLTALTRLRLSRNNRTLNIGRFTKLTELYMDDNRTIGNSDLPKLTNLTSLSLDNNKYIDGRVLLYLTKLTSLQLQYTSVVTDNVLSKMTQLTSIDLSCNDVITMKSLSCLTRLTDLDLYGTKLPAGDYLRKGSSRILKLSLGDSLSINAHTVVGLTNLTHLDIDRNGFIMDKHLPGLKSLLVLEIKRNYIITGQTLPMLTQLKSLGLAYNKKITDTYLSQMTWLVELNIQSNQALTGKGISTLTCLQRLDITNFCNHDGIAMLKNLTDLTMDIIRNDDYVIIAGLYNLKRIQTREIDRPNLIRMFPRLYIS